LCENRHQAICGTTWVTGVKEEKRMLMEYLERAVELGGDAIEFEYDEGREWFFVFKNNMSFSIASLDPREFEDLYDEIQRQKKKKQAMIGGTAYRLIYSRYDSFGEWVHRFEIKERTRTTASEPSRRPKKRQPKK
jgi:hypothetical protein